MHVKLFRAVGAVHEVNLSPSMHSRVVLGVVFMLSVLVVSRRPCGFDLVFLEQTVSLIADEDEDTQYLMQVRAEHFIVDSGRAYSQVCSMALSAVGRKTQLLSMLKHISRAGVGAMEVETASGHVLGARSIRQAMADTNLYAEGTTCDSNSILALCFTFSIATPLTGPCAPTHVAKIHNECAAQIRPCPTRGGHCRGGVN